MHRRMLALATAATLCFAAASVRATPFTAILSGDQEVPPVVTAASGSALLDLNGAMDRLTIEIMLTGLDLDGLQTPGDTNDDVVGLHIHAAPAGVNGPVVFGFMNPDSDLNADTVINAAAGTVTGAWDANEGNNTTLVDQLPNLFDGNLYLNVHTVANMAGEVRGQILAVTEPAALGLFGLGLVALYSSQRRRHA